MFAPYMKKNYVGSIPPVERLLAGVLEGKYRELPVSVTAHYSDTFRPARGRTVNNKTSGALCWHPCSTLCPRRSSDSVLLAVRRRVPGIFFSFWWEYEFRGWWWLARRGGVGNNHHAHYKSHHLCNQKCEPGANEQLACGWCAVGEPPPQPPDCSSRPACVWHINIHILRLAWCFTRSGPSRRAH